MKCARLVRVSTFAAIAALVASGASAESLVSALASAYANNPEILAASVSAQSTSEGIAIAKAGTMPLLSASAGLDASSKMMSTTTLNSTSGSIGLGYTQTLFDNGKTEANVEAARASTEAQMESARNTEQTILLAAAQSYVSVVVSGKIAALRQDTVDYLQAQVQAAKDRLNVGEGTQTDVAQAQAKLASALADQQSAAADLAVSEANYVRYIGHMPKNLSFDFPFESKLPTSVDQGLELAQNNHPSLRSAHASVRAAKALADAAGAAFGPTLKATGNVSDSLSLIGDGNTVSASVGLSLSVPLYSGGYNGASLRKANLAQISAEMTEKATYATISAAITKAWASLRTSAATIAAVKASENAYQRVLNATTEEFKVGQKTQLDVLNAKSDLTTVQITRINAESGRFNAALSLLSAIGRMSAADLGLPVEVRTPDAYRAKVEDIWQDLRAIPN